MKKWKLTLSRVLSLALVIAMLVGGPATAVLDVSAQDVSATTDVAQEAADSEEDSTAAEDTAEESAVEITDDMMQEMTEESQDDALVESEETVEATEELEELEDSEDLIEVDCSYLDEYIFQRGGTSGYEAVEEDPIARATANTSGAKTAIINGIKNRKTSVSLSSYKLTATQFETIYIAVMNENPQYFYANIYMYYTSSSNGLVTKCLIKYTGGSTEIAKYNAAVEKAFDEALPNPSGMTDLQKALVLHDYLAQHVEYDTSGSRDRYSAYDALVNGLTVCQGYTLAYKVLLEKAGISVDYCWSKSMDHIWNYVKIDGNWYHIDVTWDDPTLDSTGYVDHTYFMCSDTKFKANKHSNWASRRTCSSTKYDSGQFWNNKISAVFYIDGYMYYLKSLNNSKSIAMIANNGSTEKALFTRTAIWYVWGSTSSYYTSMYASLSYDKGVLYFNDPSTVYATTPGSTYCTSVFYLNSSATGYLYGSLACEGKIIYAIATAPNVAETRYYLETPLTSLTAKANYTQVTYGYSTAPTLTATAKKNSFFSSSISYQWYKVTTNSAGVTTESAISGATGASYTIPKGLAVGIYAYRVKAVLNGQVLSADVVILVKKSSSYSLATENVYRIYGNDRYETSFKAADAYKAQLGISKFDSVILAYGKNFPDALAGSYLASVKFAPILMVNTKDPSALNTYIKANLKAGGTVYVLGGTSAIPNSAISGLSGYNIKRLAGNDRYYTNLKILKEAGVSNQDIIVCTGKNFADSLSASAVGKPILLVGSSLTIAQKEYLSSISSSRYYILGGTSAVSDSVKSAIASYGSTSRIGGADRYATSVLVAQTFFSNAKTAVLAYAKNFPDGLSGGPLAMSKNAPLILTMTGKESTAASYARQKGIYYGAVLGGEKLISDNAAMNVFSAYYIATWY